MKILLFISLLMPLSLAYADDSRLDRCSISGGNPVWEYVSSNPDKITESEIANGKTQFPGGILQNAVMFGYEDLVYKILKADSATELEKGDALSAAASMGRIGMSRILLKYGVSVNTKNAVGTTALYAAVQYGCTDEAEFLIKHGIDVNYRNSHYKNTPLIEAIADYHFQTAAILLNYGYKPSKLELVKIRSLLLQQKRQSVWSYLFSNINAHHEDPKPN